MVQQSNQSTPQDAMRLADSITLFDPRIRERNQPVRRSSPTVALSSKI